MQDQEKSGNIRILVVDDEAGIRKLVCGMLDGYRTLSAGTAAEALETLSGQGADLIVSDVKMPGASGLGLLEEVRNLYPKIPVILMTGHGEKETVVQALRKGAFDYLEKPFVEEEILNAIQRVTDRMALERELEQARAALAHSAKLVSLGEMAGGIAHEINSPLGTIAILSDELGEMLQEEIFDQSVALESVHIIGKTVKRISSIVQGLRAISRDGSKDKFERVTIKQLFDETFHLCSVRFQQLGVELQVDPIPDHWSIECRPGQVCQVLLNLLNNSCDAIEGRPGGWIRLSARMMEERLEISVTDNGCGIPENLREKLFQPFFTTKGVGKGTGLGLSISHGIIRAHGGTLTLDAASPDTRLVISVPVAKSGKGG